MQVFPYSDETMTFVALAFPYAMPRVRNSLWDIPLENASGCSNTDEEVWMSECGETMGNF